MSVSVTRYSIIMNITFIIKTTERYFIKLIASKLMIAASNGCNFIEIYIFFILCLIIYVVPNAFFHCVISSEKQEVLKFSENRKS